MKSFIFLVAMVQGFLLFLPATSSFAKNSIFFKKIADHELQKLRSDPKAYMDLLPSKYNQKQERFTSPHPLLGHESLDKKKYIGLKNEIRSRLSGRDRHGSHNFHDPDEPNLLPNIFKAPPPAFQIESAPNLDNDHVDDLISGGIPIKNIYELDKKGLKQASLSSNPWSDDYWPIYKGILGNRYADGDFPGDADWLKNFEHIKAFLPHHIFKTGDSSKINLLSPSEKYDLLLGTIPPGQFHLTERMWAEGKSYYDGNDGKVENWMGICHGWAPASYHLDRPIQKVSVLAGDGKTPITFFPSDIKALASLLWAKARTPVRYVGGRCNEKEPKKDEKTGRIMDPECFDTNPSTWHLAATHQIGVADESFILDANFDYQVWNQPVLSYEYAYFDLNTLERTDVLKEAVLPLEKIEDDRFKDYRSDKTHSIVGIVMTVNYLVESSPSHREIDSPKFDQNQSVVYLYDLELSETGTIVGGEWYVNAHPDFLWTSPKEAKALSIGDLSLLGEPLWDGTSALAPLWVENGRLSAYNGTPLAKIIDSLIQLSRPDENSEAIK